ncbi:MAG: hypothetical protein K8F30_14250, partial [Taibaiella sp.]|nr:hypothetical protein [Taibaiella sp.]
LYAEGPQWAQVDFGESYNVERIKLWHYYGDGRTFHDVIMQLSNTADFSSGVTTVFNNDADNSAGQGVGTDAEYAGTGSGKGVTFSDVNARYVRVWSNGNSSNGSHYYVELQVYRALTEADGYIPSTLTAYTDAIAAATAVEANADATQAEIDAAEAAVDTAKAALAFVDQEALDAAEAAAAAKVEADYTPTSWAAFGAALAAANALPERSNADVVAKTTAINDAIALLAPKPVPVVTKEGHTTTVSFIIEATVDPATGTAAAKVEANIFSELVSLAKKAEASGQKAVVVLKDSVAADTKSVVVEIPRDAFNELAKGTKADVKVDTGIGTAAFNAKAVDSISGAANAGNIFISITSIDTSVLTPEVQTKVGDKPVFEFSVKAGNTKISDFNEENVEIGIPYTPKLGEKNSSVVYYIDNTGGLKIAKGKYDPEDGTVNFKISHF